MTRPDPINHPPHYTHSDVEPIDAIESWQLGFHLGNVVKYVARADHKGSKLDDLRKARWYLDREIARLAPDAGNEQRTPVTMLVQQFIEKLKREQEKDEPGCDAVLAASRGGWNARSQTLIRELEQMQAEAREKEQV